MNGSPSTFVPAVLRSHGFQRERVLRGGLLRMSRAVGVDVDVDVDVDADADADADAVPAPRVLCRPQRPADVDCL